MRSVVVGSAILVLVSTSVSAATTITGEAFIQRSNGVTLTCAGQDDVRLLPSTSVDLVQRYFSSTTRGFVPDGNQFPIPLESRSATCNSLGKFSFQNVAPGQYFVVSKINWGGNKGGIIMKSVELIENQPLEVILSATNDEEVTTFQVGSTKDVRQNLAETAIKARLIDPNSAQFEWPHRWRENENFKMWRWSKPVMGDWTCGRVNDRNRMCGYTGSSTFI
ncbi:MAG: hypothetical protein IT546_06255, partial [Caulobacteraceae bacterium]|nr:hypothetical protein [Caulobacteraceae bacterium]